MQALIFSTLTLMFTIIAIEKHDDHEEHRAESRKAASRRRLRGRLAGH